MADERLSTLKDVNRAVTLKWEMRQPAWYIPGPILRCSNEPKLLTGLDSRAGQTRFELHRHQRGRLLKGTGVFVDKLTFKHDLRSWGACFILKLRWLGNSAVLICIVQKADAGRLSLPHINHSIPTPYRPQCGALDAIALKRPLISPEASIAIPPTQKFSAVGTT